MTSSTVKKFLFTPLIVSAAVFCALSIPLQVFGTKAVDVKIKDESVFFGELKEIAPLYMKITAALSATAGVISLAVMGWRDAGRKSTQVEAELTKLAQSLQEKQELLETLKGLESQLKESSSTKAAGLKPNYEHSEGEKDTSNLLETPQPSNSETPSFVKLLTIADHPVEIQSIVTPKVQVPPATAKFASAQTFLGYTQVKDGVVSSPNTNSEVEDSKIGELESQLQQIAQEIASLKKQKLRSSPQEIRSEMGQKNNKFQSY